MILKRLIEILKSFDKEELKKFERFVRSDYFNTNESITKLFKSIKKFYPQFDSPSLTQEKLFKRIYGTRKFDDKTFRYLITEVLELAEKFIAVSAYEKRPIDEKKILIEELLTKKLFGQANRHLKILGREFEHEPVFSLDNISNKRELAILWHQLSISLDKQEPLADKRIELTEYLIFYAVTELANMFSVLVGIKRIYNIDFDDRIVESFIKNLDYKSMLKNLDSIESSLKDSKSKQITVNAFKAYLCFMITFLELKDEKYFYRMKGIIKDNSNLFSKEDLYNLYGMLGSCCHLKREAIDDIKYLKEYFEIEKDALAKGLLTHYEEQFMQAGGFITLFHTAISLNELDWAEKFVGQYIEKISPELRDDIYNYSNAQFYFGKGEFEKSLELINKVKFKYVQFKLYVRDLMLKIYYELNYFEEAFSLIDSYGHFLTSNKRVSPRMRNQNQHFLSFTKDLLKIKTDSDIKTNPTDIKNEIMKCSVVAYKPWLLEKATKLVYLLKTSS